MHAAADRELVSLEKKYWDALQKRDRDTAVELTDASCILVGAQGVGEIDPASLGQMVETASYDLQRYDINDDDFVVRKLSDDVALVAYKVIEELEVEGEPTSLEAYESSVWVKRGGRWVCAMHTESIAGDPFGRDRQPRP
jgi:hypothetical protein